MASVKGRKWGPGTKRARVQDIHVCEFCGKQFVVPAYGKRRFCSLGCRRNMPNGRTCIVCGRSLFMGKYKYCSSECAGDYKSPNRQKAPYLFNDRFKYIVRIRDGWNCALCGTPANRVHHIDFVKANTTLENCITLCESCHGYAHRDKSRIAELREKLMQVSISRTGELTAWRPGLKQ